jgi:uncharacterized protein (TIGR03084 family)
VSDTKPALADLRADLAAEQADLVRIVARLTAAEWARPTPAVGWAVRDQIAHLAYYDSVAAMAIRDPAAFAAELEQAFAGVDGDMGTYEARTLRTDLDGPGTLAHWRAQSAILHQALEAMDPAARVPWYGPPMSGASMATARMMETWAHGQDVVDAVGARREPTARLRHIAHLGVRTRGFSFTLRGQDPPSDDVAVHLTGPAGESWTWGPDDARAAANAVTGPALDFCLVVTQRRHLADTGLAIRGPVAEAWMEVAQAFAGPPGTGRSPLSSL